ncbi:MAG: DUF3619 family protein [Gallionella sp.]|nr:DUF3619 family protein [Gallionella sp.]
MKQYEPDLNHTRIAELLTQSSEQLDDRIVSSLRQARAVALQKQGLREHVLSLSAIGHRAHALMPHSTHQWLATAMLLAAIIVSVTSYCQYTQEHQGSHLDIAILTDDLPLEVFIDH